MCIKLIIIILNTIMQLDEYSSSMHTSVIKHYYTYKPWGPFLSIILRKLIHVISKYDILFYHWSVYHT